MTEPGYELIQEHDGLPIKAWVRGVPLEAEARKQLVNVARLPIIHRWVAAMPDVHWGMGATVGSVIATKRAIVPAAVGVDIGCGMMALQTSLRPDDLPDNLSSVRRCIERAVPHGRTHHGGSRDEGSFRKASAPGAKAWRRLERGYRRVTDGHKSLARGKTAEHLGTLGTGNHFIELCRDEVGSLWIMLHSGSRGVGNRIGNHFIRLAKKDMRQHLSNLPDENLAYLEEGAQHFEDYLFAVNWAQDFARCNRELMMAAVVAALRAHPKLPKFKTNKSALNCHHNYVAYERHYGSDVYVTRKGAVRAAKDQLGIIPGSMGERSFIVRGKGNPESFESCSHGAGRAMSRSKARRTFRVEDHKRATAGVECRKDEGVLDETPGAYKSIDKVMAAQRDLVEVVHTLKQLVCVKG